jgi:hypothetical protein
MNYRHVAVSFCIIGAIANPIPAADCAPITARIRRLEDEAKSIEARLLQVREELSRQTAELSRCAEQPGNAACPPATVAPSRTGAWVLKEVRTFDRFAGTRAVLDANAAGGRVTLQIPDVGGRYCGPGGSETVEVSWTFDQPISALNPGDIVRASLKARPLRTIAPCTGGLANRTKLTMATAPVSPFTGEESLRVEGRFSWGEGPGWVSPVSSRPDVMSSTGSAVFSTNPADPRRPLAWFTFIVGTPDGDAYYVYLFEYTGGR